jgi:hypothetical protein
LKVFPHSILADLINKINPVCAKATRARPRRLPKAAYFVVAYYTAFQAAIPLFLFATYASTPRPPPANRHQIEPQMNSIPSVWCRRIRLPAPSAQVFSNAACIVTPNRFTLRARRSVSGSHRKK